VTEDAAIVIVDDHELFATSLRVTLHEHGLKAFQAPMTSHDAVVAFVREVRPGLAVLDLHLGNDDSGHRIDGVDLVRPLRRLGCEVLVVSGSRDESCEAAAVAAGALAVIPKSSSFAALLDAVHTARAGRPLMPDHVRQEWLRLNDRHQAQERERARLLERLSAREREVLDLLVHGQRAAAIAEHFVVSMTTVRTQIRSILTKLEVNSQLEAVALVRSRPRGVDGQRRV
jgi:DNA-binding NarL/FixJ family response regulator